MDADAPTTHGTQPHPPLRNAGDMELFVALTGRRPEIVPRAPRASWAATLLSRVQHARLGERGEMLRANVFTAVRSARSRLTPAASRPRVGAAAGRA